MIIGLFEAQFLEKNGRHVLVEMLPGVDEHLFEFRRPGKRARQCERLYELRPGAHDRHQLLGCNH